MLGGVNVDPDHIGAVRRTIDADSVTFHVRGSRHAQIAACAVAIVPVVAIVGFIAYSAKIIVGMFSGGGMLAVSTAAYLLAVLFALTAIICWAVFKPLRRLLLTALRSLTFTVDNRELCLHTRGFGGYADVSWPRERILDVLVRYRQAGIYELNIVPNDCVRTELLYGASEAELEFLAGELRRALGIDQLLRAAAGAWGDQLDEPTSAASVAVAQPIAEPTVAPSQPMLQYAPESNDNIIRHRGAGSVRLLVPPLRPRDVLRANRWFVALFTILAIAVVEPYVFGWLRFIVRPLMMLIVPVMAFCAGMIGWHMIKCLRHTSIDATAADLMLAVRWPIVGRITTRWPVDAIRGIRAVADKPARVEFCLRSGRRQTLAYLPTYAEALDLAMQLQRAQQQPPQDVIGIATLAPPPPQSPSPATHSPLSA
jgi:hypothetical protein